MTLVERKSKSKYKVTIPIESAMDSEDAEIRDWCTAMFGEGGRNGKCRWRFGWTDTDHTFYFKHGEDASLFMLRWA
jgi:hypothetical protein